MTNNKINKELKAIDQRLSELQHEQDILAKRRESLLKRINVQQGVDQPAIVEFSVNQKIAIFNKLFKGRSDIFANRWQNSKGRSGYSVACHNEWKPGFCNKPKIKCTDCPNQKYKALDYQTTFDHLAGKQIVGLYVLLADNTCHLLAVDFDKNGWQDAVKSMAQMCLQYNIPYAVEISRSGNGAHLWLFFSEPVLARNARLLGFGLLDKAMEIHPNLSFESYDRLFPNQDTMPEGGFGNLIALPLQYAARLQGKSQFVDSNLIPYTDQWHFLSQMETISTNQINELLAALVPNHQKALDEELPWEQGTNLEHTEIENCPLQATLTIANHIYLRIDELPSLLVTRLKRLASFFNPVFFKTQALRFSTHGIPRYITCARIEQGYLSLPRGCYDDVRKLLEEQSIKIVTDDKRQSGQKLTSLKFLGKLRKDQSKAVNVIKKHNTGVMHAPTAFGKTVTAIAIIAHRKVNTLILTNNLQLLEQWQERLNSFLSGIKVGVIGGGKKKPTSQIDVATYQSFINKKDNSVEPLIQEYGQIIIDECHHISAPSFEMVLNEARAKYVLGLTATPDRQDGHQKIIFMLAGPIRHKVKTSHADKFEQHVIVVQLYQKPPAHLVNAEVRPRISDVHRWLVEDKNRTQRIVEDVISSIAKGKHPLVLTERREHAETINRLLVENKIETVILRGGMGVKERNTANERLAKTQVVVATGKYIGEGFDLPRLDTLFLALPIAWKGLLAQYVGRIHRESEGKNRVTVYDYVDCSLPMLERMFKKREKGYKAMGYQITYFRNEEK